jgi:hypothetical protein
MMMMMMMMMMSRIPYFNLPLLRPLQNNPAEVILHMCWPPCGMQAA